MESEILWPIRIQEDGLKIYADSKEIIPNFVKTVKKPFVDMVIVKCQNLKASCKLIEKRINQRLI